MKKRDRKGLFITFEKTAEGLGGTTQSKLLALKLQDLGYDAIWTRELGGTEIGKQLRELLITPRSEGGDLSYATEFFIANADRAQHYKEVLKPALLAGKIVVSDRYVDTTVAYQGGGRGFKKSDIYRLHALATGALMPDLTFILDGKPHRDKPNDDRFENLGEDFFRRVKKETLGLLDTDKRFVRIDANRRVPEVSDEIFRVVEERLLKEWAYAKRTHSST
jgi:dTMP kinase